MSRPFRTLQTLAPYTHSPLRLVRCRHSLHQQRGDVKIRPVRFRSSGLGSKSATRRAFQFLLTSLLFYRLAGYLLVDDEEDVADDAKVANTEEGREEENSEIGQFQLPEETPEDGIFIPLWFGKEREVYYYKSSDPEWQSYATFSQDQKNIDELKRHVAGKAKDGVSRHRQTQKMLGSPIRLTRAWLDIDYPMSAPPEYERLGLEMTDDYTKMATRSISEGEYKRVERVLWPYPMAKATWAGLKDFSEIQYAKLKDHFKVKSGPNALEQSLATQALDLEKLSKAGKKQVPHIKAEMDKMSDPKAVGTDGTKSEPEITNSKGISNPLKPDSSNILSSLPQLLQPGPEMRAVMAKHIETFVQTSQRRHTIPRGAFTISGLVEFAGPRGLVLVDLIALYHPKTSELKILEMRRRRIRPLKVRPWGGP